MTVQCHSLKCRAGCCLWPIGMENGISLLLLLLILVIFGSIFSCCHHFPFHSSFFLSFPFLSGNLGYILPCVQPSFRSPLKNDGSEALKLYDESLGTTCRFSSSTASRPADLWLMTRIYLICNLTLPIPLSFLRTLEHILFSQVRG